MTADGYAAARSAGGLVAGTDRGLLAVTGPDRLAWLQGLVTNDVAGLLPGHGCYAAYLTPQGRMISDVGILALDEVVLLDVPAGSAAMLRERFESLVIMEDVQIADLSSRIARLSVHGPASPDLVGGWAATVVGSASQWRARLVALSERHGLLVRFAPSGQVEPAAAATLDERTAVVVASRALGPIGFDLLVPAAAGSQVTDALVGAGAVPLDHEAAEALRIEAGRPAFGVDMDESTIPLETGLEDRMISFTKGCYVGQEVIVRVRDRGHGRVARRLVGLVATGDGNDRRLSAGTTLTAGDRDVGRITSAAWSPALQREIALGYVHRDIAAPGTALVAVHGDFRTALTTSSLPFVSLP